MSKSDISTSNIYANVDSKNEPILLLNGFGVGSFHQHRLIPELLKDDSSNSNAKQKPRTVYCIDYLGQGRSWPKHCMDGKGENEKDLQYSANTWCEQIIDFIEQVVVPSEKMQTNNDNERAGTATTKVHLVGNSVGGHLAAHIAMRRPDLVSSICLLNPTPVWGSKLVGWNGHLPAPIIPKTIGRYLFDRIRDLKTIDKFLESVYSTKEAYTEELMQQIRGATLGNGGHAAFASIMWSAPLQSSSADNSSTNFQNCLRNLPSDLDVFLVFGQDDPWCKPAFAKNMLKALEERRRDIDVGTSSIVPTTKQQHKRESVQRYVQITNAGHCPNHEAPKAVGHLVRAWVNAKDDGRHKGRLSFVVAVKKNSSVDANRDHDHQAMPMPTTSMSFAEEWAEHTVVELDGDDIPLSLTDRIFTTFM